MGGKGSGGWRPHKEKVVPPQSQIKLEPGDNAKMITNVLAGWDKPKVNTRSAEAIDERIREYLVYCIEHDTRPLVSGCALWLGVSGDTLRDWYTGRFGTPEIQAVVGKFYAVIKTLWDEYMQNGKINPVAGIYISKVYFGYKDTQEIVVKETNSQDKLGISDLLAEAKLLPGADHLALEDGQQIIEGTATEKDS